MPSLQHLAKKLTFCLVLWAESGKGSFLLPWSALCWPARPVFEPEDCCVKKVVRVVALVLVALVLVALS